MTEEEARALDRAVAEAVFGRPWPEDEPMLPWQGSWICVCPSKENKERSCERWPRYSAEIAAAWKVVEAMLEQDVTVGFMSSKHMAIVTMGRYEGAVDGYASTVPEGICRAALKYLEKERESVADEKAEAG